MLDILERPVVDSHCHAFLPENETDSFEQYLTLADHPVPKRDMINTFLYRQVVRELSRVLNVKGTHEEIIGERHKRYMKDPVGYIKLLFEDANIETLLVDTGYPAEEFSGYSIDLKDFSKLVPSEVREIFRIDLVVYDVLKSQLPFDVAVDQFHEQTRNAVKNGAVGLKSVIAYRTGLEIQRSTEEEVRKVYDKFIAEARLGKSVRDILSSRSKHVKTVYDYFLFLGVEDSVELDVPFQMHVGMGDAPFIDLRLANPILLHDLINDESGKKAKIVLTHGGYPYLEEAGFLVNAYPNVFLDLSETIPFISVGIKEKLLNLFEMAPTTKIMYGSDGYNIPELHWISSIQTKKALSAALNELLESKEIDEEWAQEITKDFLSENAKRIYRL
jgi:predicted TIM-barrel fold metal-dependent hydrolase